jgi:hypothetical protein
MSLPTAPARALRREVSGNLPAQLLETIISKHGLAACSYFLALIVILIGKTIIIEVELRATDKVFYS